MAAGSWRGLLDCKNKVKEIATKLRTILDTNDRTYRGYIVIPLEFSASFIHLLSQGLPFTHLDEIVYGIGYRSRQGSVFHIFYTIRLVQKYLLNIIYL